MPEDRGSVVLILTGLTLQDSSQTVHNYHNTRIKYSLLYVRMHTCTCNSAAGWPASAVFL